MERLQGDWTLHTYIGERVFQDRLHLEADAEGELHGTLSVPGGFQAEVESLEKRDATHFTFSIQPDEGNGRFRVNYSAELDPKDEVFIGFARLDDGNLIGGFVGKRPPVAG